MRRGFSFLRPRTRACDGERGEAFELPDGTADRAGNLHPQREQRPLRLYPVTSMPTARSSLPLSMRRRSVRRFSFPSARRWSRAAHLHGHVGEALGLLVCHGGRQRPRLHQVRRQREMEPYPQLKTHTKEGRPAGLPSFLSCVLIFASWGYTLTKPIAFYSAAFFHFLILVLKVPKGATVFT